MFRKLKATVAMYQGEGHITFDMAQKLLTNAIEDLEELTNQMKATLSEVQDGVTIEFHTEGSIIDFVMGRTPVCPIKARIVLDEKSK